MSKEVMKLALSTLEGWANYDDWVWPESALEQAKRNTIEAITALRQALVDADDTSQERVDEIVKHEHEPVAWANSFDLQNFDMKVRTGPDLQHTVPLYAAPQKQWVSLTDEEVKNIVREAAKGSATKRDGSTSHRIAQAIEAKLKEKNT